MRKFLYLFVFITLMLYGCHDDYRELGDTYIYESGRIDKIIDKKTGTIDILIPEQVLNYAHDKNYIIAYQIPDSAIYRYYYIDSYKRCSDSTKQSRETTDSLEALLDRMLSIQNCYWIIRKRDVKVYGPMKESDFYRQCKKMNIMIKMDKKYESTRLKYAVPQ